MLLETSSAPGRRSAQKAADAPSEPGVYLMKGSTAKSSMSARPAACANAWQPISEPLRIPIPRSMRWWGGSPTSRSFLTRTEKEALILESNLIKRHRPRFNVVLKDDKRYPLCGWTRRRTMLGSPSCARSARTMPLFRPLCFGACRARNSQSAQPDIQTAQMQGE